VPLSPETFLTPAATVVAVVLANSLTYGRGNKEKLWELRRQAYGVILSELVTIERICDAADEYMRENVHRYFEGGMSHTHADQIAEHMARAMDRFEMDYLIMSNQFLALYEGFTDAMSGDWNDDPLEARERLAAAVRGWRPRLVSQARSEMPFSRRPPWSLLSR
jgi:hypothetical protein